MSILATLTGECESLSDNPCVGWCTTRQFGDDRCKGCGRLESTIKQCVPTGWRPNIKPQVYKEKI